MREDRGSLSDAWLQTKKRARTEVRARPRTDSKYRRIAHRSHAGAVLLHRVMRHGVGADVVPGHGAVGARRRGGRSGGGGGRGRGGGGGGRGPGPPRAGRARGGFG